jgi:hypothetical protein
VTNEYIATLSARRPKCAAELERVTSARGGRTYKLPGHDEIALPSVTTVLGKVWPKPALMNWFAKRGREAMAEYLGEYMGEPITPGLLENAVAEAKMRPRADAQDAANLGSEAHVLIERQLKGEVIHVPVALRSVIEAFNSWLGGQELELVDSEVAVYTATPGASYAGTIDALFERPDKTLVLVDFKTSKAVYPDHLVQLAAYASAVRWMSAGPRSITSQVIRLGKEQPEFEVVSIVDEHHALARWKATLAMYNALEAKS